MGRPSNKRIGTIAGFLLIGLIFSGTIVIFHAKLDSSNSYLTRDRRQTYQWNLLGPSSPECPIFKSCNTSSMSVSMSCQFQTDCTSSNKFCCPGMDGKFCCQNQAPTPFPVVPVVGTVTTTAFTGSTTLSSSTVTGLTATTNNFTTTPFTGTATTATPVTGSTSAGTPNTGSTASAPTGTAGTTGTATATTGGTLATGQTTGATAGTAATTAAPTTTAAAAG